MKRFATIIWTLVGIITVGLAIDYVNVTRKERLLSNADVEMRRSGWFDSHLAARH